MRKLLLTGAVAAGLGFAVVGTAGAATHNCGNIGQNVGNVKATNTSCATAKKVARTDNKGKKTPGWKCTYKQYPGGVTVTCKHKGNQKVTYQFAD